ncbi:hypothetical protein Ddye_026664 [Dipteronia dyeriana]|uniref:Uncharacterized protein n=1 Tax=Dipteronia dyeriana TaxID=168575 RepID=A0AAD9TNK0_9ROSI|nr:hypothetical protein Ddye_026664 [Dipteronia dyeriana]
MTVLQEAMPRLIGEIRFFSSYTQRICISNSAGEAVWLEKGHTLLYEAFSLITKRHPGVYLLVTDSDPWEEGYTFSPNVKSFAEALEVAIRDGPIVLQRKGIACKQHTVSMFTATKMASAYERFFLCMKNTKYFQYPLSTDC